MAPLTAQGRQHRAETLLVEADPAFQRILVGLGRAVGFGDDGLVFLPKSCQSLPGEAGRVLQEAVGDRFPLRVRGQPACPLASSFSISSSPT